MAERRVGGWMRSIFVEVLGGIGAIVVSTPGSPQSLIVPDTTLGTEPSTVIQNFNGLPVEAIAGGAQRGANLFHSFSEFNVATGRGAYFFSPNAAIQNILARVTGTNPSEILGTLGTFGNSQPNLFLINPNGIIFGQNASLAVGGSFYGTTASGIKFGDLGEFSAINPQSPANLLTINPTAFFFTSRTPGAIVNQSQATQTVLGDTTFGLRVRNGQALLLLGGNVTIDGGQLNAFGGRVEIGAVADVGNVTLNLDGILSLPDGLQRGNVTITNGSSIDVRLSNRGDVNITADNINIVNGSQLLAGILPGSGTATSQAGDITLNATGLVQVVGRPSRIENVVDKNASGDSGNIRLTANALEIRDGALLMASTFGTGNAGNVMIEAHDYVLFSGRSADGRFSSAAYTSVAAGAQGKGGNIQISTNILEVLDGSQLISSTEGIGDAGNVVIEVRNRALFTGTSTSAFSSVAAGAQGKGGNVQIYTNVLEVLNGAGLIASTEGIGNAGNVMIEAHDYVLFSGRSANGQFPSAAFSNVEPGAQGKGGNVQISTNNLEVLDGSQLIADTRSVGDAGSVVIEARNRALFSGTDASGLSPSAAFSSVEAGAKGKGGNVQISASNLEVLNGAQLIASTEGAGDAGDVVVEARNRVLFSDGDAFSSVASGAKGKGGNIRIYTSSLEILNGGQLIASDRSTEGAGNVAITARDSVLINGVSIDGRSSAVFTFTTTEGRGGNIIINTDAFQISEGAVVDARTIASGNSGNVVINAETVDILNGGQLLATTEGSGRAGNITVNAVERLTIAGTDSKYTIRLAQSRDRVAPVSASSGIFVRSQGTGGAGDITVTSPQILMDRGVISAESAAVDGGNINLNVGQLLLMRNGSLISTTAGTAQQGGNGGNITINLPKGFVIGVKSENSDITANAFSGSGGRVNITAQGIFGLQFRPRLTEFSDITASSTFGVNGIVTLNTPNVDPSRGLAQLPQNLIDTNRILANSCIVRDAASGGTFIITGTGGLPVRPGDAVLPVFATGEVRGVEERGRQGDEGMGKTEMQHPGAKIGNVDAIAEAQGIYQLPDGQIILSWECAK